MTWSNNITWSLVIKHKRKIEVYNFQYSIRLYYVYDILVTYMAFGLLLLLRFKVTESYNDIKLKNHKHIQDYKSIEYI